MLEMVLEIDEPIRVLVGEIKEIGLADGKLTENARSYLLLQRSQLQATRQEQDDRFRELNVALDYITLI
jgi:hypothetical protein